MAHLLWVGEMQNLTRGMITMAVLFLVFEVATPWLNVSQSTFLPLLEAARTILPITVGRIF